MFPRGIAPDLLLAGVKNTVPYFAAERSLDSFPPAEFLRDFAGGDLSRELSHFEYFRLCLSAHYLTCGTPVPTDVDNQIRHRLWPKNLPLEIALEMAGLVLESRDWDFRKVSERHVEIGGTAWIAGHHGEWFTVAAGAYGALAQYSAQSAKDLQALLLDAIGEVVTLHSEVFGELWRAGDGVQALRASAVIAHNFGDLDRVMEMWSLSVTDPLRLNFHGLTTKALSAEGKLKERVNRP